MTNQPHLRRQVLAGHAGLSPPARAKPDVYPHTRPVPDLVWAKRAQRRRNQPAAGRAEHRSQLPWLFGVFEAQ